MQKSYGWIDVVDRLEGALARIMEVQIDIGSRIEALEHIAHKKVYQDTSEPSDITRPVLLTYTQQMNLNDLLKKDRRELR